jgi:hypothetical protein
MSYHESQQRILEAEEALKAGDIDRARTLFHEAAGLQRTFVDSLPADRVRTKSVYGLSAATLLYKANALDEAERLAHHFLSQVWFEPYSSAKLRELLIHIGHERSLQGRKPNAITQRLTQRKIASRRPSVHKPFFNDLEF